MIERKTGFGGVSVPSALLIFWVGAMFMGAVLLLVGTLTGRCTFPLI